jgi:glycosyltransferase involved in cell wall biosynthesis
MIKEKLISAILPTYNRSNFLIERILEIKNQTYDNWELLIINDNSSDDTEEKVKPYISEKIKLINLKKNSGSVSIPRAIGICNSIGEFIAPIDDDVVNLPNKFEDLINGFEKNIVLSYGNRKNFYCDSKTLTEDIKKPNWNPLENNGWGIDNGQFIYKSNVYEKIPITFPKRACDWELAKLIKPLGEFKYIDKTVSIYQVHDKNRSHDESTKYKDIYPEEYEEFFNRKRFEIKF